MKPIPHRPHAAGKRKIRRRLDRPVTAPAPDPVFTASNIHYEVASKTRAIACGGIGAIQLLVRKLGLAGAIDRRLHLLKFHLPYHESDHVLDFAYRPPSLLVAVNAEDHPGPERVSPGHARLSHVGPGESPGRVRPATAA